MDISRLLSQSVSWQKITSTDTRDDPTYATALTLPARKVQRLKDLIGKDGEVTTATNEITLLGTATVAVGDLLDGREVVALTDMRTIAGELVGIKALTR